jgi:hypothetical protein
MTLEEAKVRYAQEPRYALFVDYLRDVVWSGSFAGPEVVAAAQLAVELAEAKRELRHKSYQGQPTVRPTEQED